MTFNKIIVSVTLALFSLSSLAAPTITSTAVTTATSGIAYTYTASATDSNSRPLTWTAPTLPSWLRFSDSGLAGAVDFVSNTDGVPGGLGYDEATGITYYGTIDGGPTIYKVDAAGNKSTFGVQPTECQARGSFVIHNSRLYVACHASISNSIVSYDLTDTTGSAAAVNLHTGTQGFIALAVRSNVLYASNYGANKIYTIDWNTGAKTEYWSTFTDGVLGPHGMLVDTNGDLYLTGTNSGVVKKKSTGGTVTDVLIGITSPTDIKKGLNGKFYISSSSGGLKIYPPDFSTPETVPVSSWSMTFNNSGSLILGDSVSKLVKIGTGAVLYGTPTVGNAGVHPVSLSVTDGTTPAAQNFSITVIAEPSVSGNSASGLTVTGATLGNTVSSNGAASTVTFEYGLTTAYGSTATAAESPLASSASAASVSAAITGLTCGTVYHYRVKAVNSVNTTNGSDATFSTSCNAAPAAYKVSISATSQVGSVLNGYYVYSDTDSDPEGVTTFRWVKNSTNTGATGGISVGTSRNYTLVTADFGAYLYFCVTPVASAGTLTGVEACSSATAAVVMPAPTVTAVNPTSGPSAGGTAMTITGTNLTGATAITIGGAACTSVNVASATSATCTTAAGTAGSASVVVTTVGGTNAANTLFTYVAPPTVTAVNPTSGPSAGGTAITITGTNLTGATAITVGGAACTSVSASATSTTCTTTAGTAGSASVVVTTVGGANAANTLFTYQTNAVCGTAASVASSIVPSANLCTAGTAGQVSSSQGQFRWTCSGISGGTNASCTAPWATNAGTGSGSLTASGNGWTVSSASFAATPTVAPTAGVTFPNGLLDLRLSTGSSGTDATVVVQYSTAVPAGAVYMKYGKTAANQTDHWYQLAASRAVFAADRMSVTLTLTDGGAGDNDLLANGTIVDPGGPALVPADPIPTLSEWAMIFLASLMGLFAFVRIRRQS